MPKPSAGPGRTGAVTIAADACGVGPGQSILPARMVLPAESPLERAMARFAGGDDAALGDVYDLASPAVFTFLLRMCRDRALAEDLTQETFMRIHRARGLYRPGAAVMPWAYTIARRLFLDSVRAGRGHKVAQAGASATSDPIEIGTHGDASTLTSTSSAWTEPAPSAEDLFADRELSAAVDEALARIPEAQASAFRLLKGEGLSLAETAAVMGTTKGAVKLRAHRAYQALRGMLAGHLAAGGGPRRTMSGRKIT